MEVKKLISNNKNKVLLFFAGWGMDERPFSHLGSKDYDVFIAYDYHSLHFDPTLFINYKEVYIVAWSMGVWAVSMIAHTLNIKSAVAINGTERPVDDLYGIPCPIVQGTLEQLSPESLSRFNRRMCGNRSILDFYNASFPLRTIESLRKELESIYAQRNQEPTNSVPWEKAIIGGKDSIFPPLNGLRFWKTKENVSLISTDTTHYPFHLWNNWEEIIK
ncbi:MAG: DUF452 family protein [Bacteroidales bacterium]|nr:DUF452 family protein [Bacteroidales bacterium]